MAIRVVRNNNGNCVTFVGSSQPAYWNACLSGQVNSDDSGRVDVVNDVRTTDDNNPVYEFYGVPYTEFQDADGNSFSDSTEAAAYITEKANVIGGAIELDAITVVNFTRDNTNTSVLTSLGDSFGVNSVKAIGDADGNITIREDADTGVALYTSIRPYNVTINGQTQTTALNAVINALNALFNVTPVGAGADDPTVSNQYGQTTPNIGTFGNVTISGGIATKGSNSGSQFNDGFYTIGQAVNSSGEYFEFDNTGYAFDRKFTIGLLETSKFDAGDSTTLLENITSLGSVLDLAVRLGPNAAFENSDYGVVIENGFYEAPGKSSQFRAGVDNTGRLSISHYKNGEWLVIVRSAFIIDSSEEYMLVCHMVKENAQVNVGTVRTNSLVSDVPLQYRYIESPDGSFYYPLFSNRSEADYVSQNAFTLFGAPYVNDTDTNSDGFHSHSHVFIDEPTNTTWYMPDNYMFHANSSAPANTASITYTAIQTNADGDYVPAAYSSSTSYTFNELDSVNIEITPTDISYTTIVSGLPPCITHSGRYLTGTIDPISATETYTVTITRSNTFGSSVGTLSITLNDNANLGNIADFTEIDGNFYQPNQLFLDEDAVAQYDVQINQDEQLTYSFNSASTIPPTIGILSATGQNAVTAYDSSTDTLGVGASGSSPGTDFKWSTMWDLRFITFASIVGGTLSGNDNEKDHLVGWDDNDVVFGISNDNLNVTIALKYGTDGYLRLYRNGALLKTSANTFSGAQTLTIAAFADQTQNSVFIPSNFTISNQNAGSTTAPSGFKTPIAEGAMATSTLLGNVSTDDSTTHDAAAELNAVLNLNHRFILPKTWVQTNILPYIDTTGADVFFGIPTSSVNWTDVALSDFDAVISFEGTANPAHTSRLEVASSDSSVTDDTTNINSLTNAFFDYALEWDGDDLHVIACNIGDINTQPSISNGGQFSRVMTYHNYVPDDSANGSLPLFFAVDDQGQVNLTTSGLQEIRTPFGANDILVAESSTGNGQFKTQPAAAAFDASVNGHAPSGYGFTFGGVTTVNAGYTYRFIYHPSMETDDKIEFRLASDNTTVYTTGVTTFGSGDPSTDTPYKGIQFIVPADAPPLTLYYYNSHSGGSYDAGRAVSISGSTYVASITGITKEGPAANQTGTNVMDAGEYGWISLNEQLSAGERLVLDNAFLENLLNTMRESGDNSNTTGINCTIGLRGPNFTNTAEIHGHDISGQFLGNHYIRLIALGIRTREAGWVIHSNGVNGNNGSVNTTSGFASVCGFLEVTNSGNNIRSGMGSNGSYSIVQGDESTKTYGDWTGYKRQTGEQGYGITSEDVVMGFWTFNAGDFDGDLIDWTDITEVSVPTPAATITTPWTKALDFSGSSERAKMTVSSATYNVLRMGDLGTTIAAPTTSGNTSSASTAKPWATTIVFSSDNNSSNQHIWNQGEGAGSTDDNIYLRVGSARDLHFGWGRTGALNECSLGTLASGSGNWSGIYIAHTGERLSGSNATAANLADCFDIRFVDLSTGVVGSQLSTSSNWSTNGGRMDRAILGDFTIGGRDSNRNFHGKIASMVITTLKLSVSMPDATEISMMVRDPKQWVDDYRVGETYRYAPYSYNNSNFQRGNFSSISSTQVWLMGDSSSDAYAKIRNQVWDAQQSYTTMDMVSMVSNDIETVNISGLT